MAAARSRFSMVSQGVRRSLRLMTAKSCISGAPRTAAPEEAAVTPGTISTETSGYSRPISRISPAMPYTPASPLQIMAVVLPFDASENARRHRSVSRRMGVVRNSFSG